VNNATSVVKTPGPGSAGRFEPTFDLSVRQSGALSQ